VRYRDHAARCHDLRLYVQQVVADHMADNRGHFHGVNRPYRLFVVQSLEPKATDKKGKTMHLSASTPVAVSGGASGLGEAVVRRMRKAGCPVAILDVDAERGERVAGECGALFVTCDVTDAASVRAAIEQARGEHGVARLAVTCAGIAPGAKTVGKGVAHDPALFAKTISINLLGAFHVASIAAEGMIGAEPMDGDERGVVINTASVAAYEGQIGQVAYASSKGAVAAMTLPMARDLARDGVRVMGIAPGLFLTPMLEGLPQEVQDSLGKTVPFPARLGNPDEFAMLVQHIARNAMLNGEVVRLDGAIRMQPK
jgi:NAD(P)-dependent dehydrogenase (short-subunit alcohol dehydrogenase family)